MQAVFHLFHCCPGHHTVLPMFPYDGPEISQHAQLEI